MENRVRKKLFSRDVNVMGCRIFLRRIFMKIEEEHEMTSLKVYQPRNQLSIVFLLLQRNLNPFDEKK